MANLSLDRITNGLMNKFLETYEIQSSSLTKDFERFIEDLQDLKKAKKENKNEPCYSLKEVKQILNIK